MDVFFFWQAFPSLKDIVRTFTNSYQGSQSMSTEGILNIVLRLTLRKVVFSSSRRFDVYHYRFFSPQEVKVLLSKRHAGTRGYEGVSTTTGGTSHPLASLARQVHSRADTIVYRRERISYEINPGWSRYDGGPTTRAAVDLTPCVYGLRQP